MKVLKNLIFLLSFSVFSGLLYAENFRVHSLISMPINELEESSSAVSGINDALFIKIPKDLTYVSGIEINLKIPEVVATWQDSVAYMIYDEIKQDINEKRKDYSGQRKFLNTLPGKLSLTIYIPLSQDFSIKDNPYSIKVGADPELVSFIKDKGLFFRFMMVMKGVPESLENAEISVTTKLVLKNKGLLELSLSPQSSEEKKYSVFIDDKPVQDYQQLFLSTGEHHLSVVSDSYRNELRTFRIERARKTNLAVKLRGIEPIIKILCPGNTSVFIDEEAVQPKNEYHVVSQGEHTVKFLVGDYEIVKTVSAQKGRTYTVNLDINASVSEEE